MLDDATFRDNSLTKTAIYNILRKVKACENTNNQWQRMYKKKRRELWTSLLLSPLL
jgi:hypothetical protein